jgi:hypothetical protein
MYSESEVGTKARRFISTAQREQVTCGAQSINRSKLISIFIVPDDRNMRYAFLRARPAQFACRPASVTTRFHRVMSSRMKAPKASLVVETGNIICGSSWALTSGKARTALTCLLS